MEIFSEHKYYGIFKEFWRMISVGISGFAMIPVSVIIMFLFVGVIEEIMKMSAVHAVDDNRIRDIDDAVMFAIWRRWVSRLPKIFYIFI